MVMPQCLAADWSSTDGTYATEFYCSFRWLF